MLIGRVSGLTRPLFMAYCAANVDKQPNPSPAETLLINASVVLISKASCQWLSFGARVLIKTSREPEPGSLNTQSLCSKSVIVSVFCLASGWSMALIMHISSWLKGIEIKSGWWVWLSIRAISSSKSTNFWQIVAEFEINKLCDKCWCCCRNWLSKYGLIWLPMVSLLPSLSLPYKAGLSLKRCVICRARLSNSSAKGNSCCPSWLRISRLFTRSNNGWDSCFSSSARAGRKGI